MSTQFNCQKIFLFQTIQAVIYNNSVYCKYSFNVKTVLFQIIQFSISTQFKCKDSLIEKNISIPSYSV